MKETYKKNAIRALEQLGLGENEAKLYTILLRHGEASVLELQQASPFPRTLLYYILNNLVHLGLISFIKKPQRTVYVVEDPDRLYDLLREREDEFERNKLILKESIPEFKNQFRVSQNRPGVRIFEGVENYRSALSDIIETRPNQVFSFLSFSEKKKLGVEIREHMAKERRNWGISEKVLLFDTPQANIWIKKFEKEGKKEFRFLHPRMEFFEGEIYIYENKVLHVSAEGKEIISTLTEEKNFSIVQKNIFSFLWSIAKKI